MQESAKALGDPGQAAWRGRLLTSLPLRSSASRLCRCEAQALQGPALLVVEDSVRKAPQQRPIPNTLLALTCGQETQSDIVKASKSNEAVFTSPQQKARALLVGGAAQPRVHHHLAALLVTGIFLGCLADLGRYGVVLNPESQSGIQIAAEYLPKPVECHRLISMRLASCSINEFSTEKS